MKRLVPLFVVAQLAVAQSPSFINSSFDLAAQEFGVPADILKGIAFAETRWDHLTWADGDTASCMGMPHPYGIMSLWDNDYFGHSLREAAALIGQDPTALKQDVTQNIRGAAALLKKYHDELPLPEGTASGDIESWRSAIVKFCGIPQQELAQQHALDIYRQMSKGYHAYHISWDGRPVKLENIKSAVEKVWLRTKASRLQKNSGTTSQPDYPYAKWAEAYPGHWYTTGYKRDFVVIHDMEGYYLSVISYFQQSSTNASIYYDVNGLQDTPSDAPAGEITQQVEEKYWAWHVRCWNRYMFGIEHEGFVSNPAWFTDTMYKASAELTAYLCKKYGITIDRNHIIGHQEWQNSSWVNWIYNTYNPLLVAAGIPTVDPTCNDHTDPGPNWNWTYYMNLVQSYATSPPKVVSSFPAANAVGVRAYKNIEIRFTASMDTAVTNAAFSISPSVAGTKRWSPDGTVLTFQPSSFLAFSTVYTVTIDSSAKGVVYNLDGNGDGTGGDAFQFSFTTQQPDTSAPTLLHIYPSNGDMAVPLFPELSVLVDEPVGNASLTSLLQLKDSTGGVVSSVTLVRDSLNDRGFLRLIPASLNPNAFYTFVVSPGIRDLFGNTAQFSSAITFKTICTTVSQGILYDGFDSNVHYWQQPVTQGGTTLVDSSGTSFGITSEKKRSGTASGKLSYKFVQSSGGVVVLDAIARPYLDAYSTIGVWVCGDESRNRLKAVFQPSNQQVDLGLVTWRGWEFLNISLPSLAGPDRQFSDFVLQQTDSGSVEGAIFFDDMRVNAVVTDIAQPALSGPIAFRLDQNFPNPFNPATAINFQLSANSFVTLSVYDLLGRKIAVLVNGQRVAGAFRVEWNAQHVPSGVYFYKLQARPLEGGKGFVETKKMVLMK